MDIVKWIHWGAMALFFLCYSYQFYYLFRALPPEKESSSLSVPLHRIAILIAARNEEAVLGELLKSIAAQDYPAYHVRVFVAADNCTDGTAELARQYGAAVYERHDTRNVGKGYALRFLLECIHRDYPTGFDAFLVLDADNVLAENYLTEINRTFSEGYGVVTSYRNSKNYGDNWISAGYALWFLRESRYLNGARCRLGTSCAVSGTGFLFSREVLRRCGGWRYFLLTEDIEFTIDCVVRGERIGYCPRAVLYDEQPTSFAQSWRQRLRWARGYLQVFGRYGKALLRGIGRGSFSCFDMTMNILPAAVLTGLCAVVDVTAAVLSFRAGGDLLTLAQSLGQTLLGLCGTLTLIGAVTTVTEWRQIHCSTARKLFSILTFPLFMLTYLPICAAALFVCPTWQPIRHQRSMTLREIRAGKL